MIPHLIFLAICVIFAVMMLIMLPYFSKLKQMSDFTPDIVWHLTKRLGPLFLLIILLMVFGGTGQKLGWF